MSDFRREMGIPAKLRHEADRRAVELAAAPSLQLRQVGTRGGLVGAVIAEPPQGLTVERK